MNEVDNKYALPQLLIETVTFQGPYNSTKKTLTWTGIRPKPPKTNSVLKSLPPTQYSCQKGC